MRRAIVAALVMGGGVAHADTLGLLRCTHDGAEFRTKLTAAKPVFVVARDAGELAAAKSGSPALDFAREMLVGVVNMAKTDDVIYRIDLDDAVAPTALVVHLGPPDAPCGDERTPAAARAHYVVTARSDLPVHFVRDVMIDGRMFTSGSSPEGVDVVDLATLPGRVDPTKATGAPTREIAERIARRAITPTDLKKLVVGPMDRMMPRVPHGWTRVAVALDAKGVWSIAFDDVRFTVDRATGSVARTK